MRPNYCEESSKTDASELLSTVAYFGRLGCDLPQAMVDAAFAKMAYDNADLDGIFVPGDLIGHGISIDLKYDKDITDEEADARYTQLKQTHETLSGLF